MLSKRNMDSIGHSKAISPTFTKFEHNYLFFNFTLLYLYFYNYSAQWMNYFLIQHATAFSKRSITKT